MINVKRLIRNLIFPVYLIYNYTSTYQPLFWSFLAFYWAFILAFKFLERRCVSPRRRSGKPTDKLNVLLVGDAFPPKVDGVATFAVHTITELQRKGHTVQVITSVTDTPDLFGAKVTRLPGTRLKYAPEHSVSIPLPWTCIYLLYSMKPDAVHLFEYSFLTPFMAMYCYMVGIPCSWSHHTRIDLYLDVVEFPWYFPNWFQHAFYNFTDPIFTSFANVQLPVCKNLFNKFKHRYGMEDVR